MLDRSTVTLGAPRPSRAEYGSDLVVEMLGHLGISHIAVNPGSSYRGIHDSLVNFPGDGVPEMIQCCHEEVAIAVAYGYARASGKIMAAAVHNVVGLQHASMAIYNSWCDRIPMLVVGGTGPMAVEHRRDHIDWVHTALVQGNLVRDFVKWDDQPATIGSIPESLLRGYRLAMTEPSAPVYLCYDVDLQEQAISEPIMLPDARRFQPPAGSGPNPDALAEVAAALAQAQWPVLLVDGLGRHPEAVRPLGELAEMLAAPVISAGSRFNIASNHPLNLSSSKRDVLTRADVVLALDCMDLAAALGPGLNPELNNTSFAPPEAKIFHIGLWDLLQSSLISDYGRLAATDLSLTADTSVAVPILLEECRRLLQRDTGATSRLAARRDEIQRLHFAATQRREQAMRSDWNSTPLSLDRLWTELWEVVKDVPWSIVHGGARGVFRVTEPGQVVGGIGRGGGLGQSTGAAIGATIAFRNEKDICISVVGDGDLLYTPSALWTATSAKLPLLTIVNNNRAYGNDEGHQTLVARKRGRSVENAGVGIYLDEPSTDFAKMAQSFGMEGIGPISRPEQIRPALENAVSIILKEQRPVLLDVHTARRSF